jgi:16S rRNA (cytosine967-C5)-methyltransferase
LQPAPLDLRVNLLKSDRAAVMAALTEAGIEAELMDGSATAIRVSGKPAIERLAAFTQGWFEVQDAGSQRLVEFAAPRRGQTVVDFCAGAGGKTLAMAAQMEGTGTITALDIHGGRLKALQERARRAGAHNIRAVDLEESGKILKRLKNTSDLVLVDAPCTGTGVLRRNPDTGWRLQPEDVERLTVLQRSLLDRYAPLVKAGGRLVYATCSLLPEENMGAVTHFLASHPDFVLEDAPLSLTPADSDAGARWDGFFTATLRRVAAAG